MELQSSSVPTQSRDPQARAICAAILHDCVSGLPFFLPRRQAEPPPPSDPPPALAEDCFSPPLPPPKRMDDGSGKKKSPKKKVRKSPMSVEKLKIRVGEPIQKLKITPEKLGKSANASKVKCAKDAASTASDNSKEPFKVKIIPPKSKKLLTFSSVNDKADDDCLDPYALDLKPTTNHSVSKKSPKKSRKSTNPAKISKAMNSNTVNVGPSMAIAKTISISSVSSPAAASCSDESRRKYSIFKSRNSAGALGGLPTGVVTSAVSAAAGQQRVQFTDVTIGKNLCIRSVGETSNKTATIRAADAKLALNPSPSSHPTTATIKSTKPKASLSSSPTKPKPRRVPSAKPGSKLTQQQEQQLAGGVDGQADRGAAELVQLKQLEQLDLVEDEFSLEQGALVSPTKLKILASPSQVFLVLNYNKRSTKLYN